MGVTTHYFYDGAGRKIKEICQDQQVSYHYDTLGRLEKTIRHGEGEHQQIEYSEYDHLDRVILKQQMDQEGT
jgi:YD repeat-containing protein